MNELYFPATILLYIDPGTGFIILQVIMGGILGGIFYFRTAVRSTLRRLRSLVGRKDIDLND